jgi:hypothetical protein
MLQALGIAAMRFYIPPAVAIALLALVFVPKHNSLRIGAAQIDAATLDAAELFVRPGMTALRGMDLKSLKTCFLDAESRVKLLGKEQGDDGAVLRLQLASGRIVLVHFRFFDDHRFALLDAVVTPEGVHIVDPEQLWGMANAIILGNCGKRAAQ